MAGSENAAPKVGGKERIQLVSSELCEEPETDEEAYLEWKAQLANRGKLPEDAVVQYKALGMIQYAEKLEAVIQQMEGMFEAPV